MQPVFDMLIKYQRDLQRIGENRNVRVTRDGNKIQMSVPGATIKCDYLLPWTKHKIRYGVILDRQRIQYINIINDLYAQYSQDDSHIYFECKDEIVRVYKLSPDHTSKVMIYEFDLVPIKSWLFTKIFC